MVKLITPASAVTLFKQAAAEEDFPSSAKELLGWIMKNRKEDELEFFVAYNFPHGTDIYEYVEFFATQWRDIATELGYPILRRFNVFNIVWDKDGEGYSTDLPEEVLDFDVPDCKHEDKDAVLGALIEVFNCGIVSADTEEVPLRVEDD